VQLQLDLGVMGAVGMVTNKDGVKVGWTVEEEIRDLGVAEPGEELPPLGPRVTAWEVLQEG